MLAMLLWVPSQNCFQYRSYTSAPNVTAGTNTGGFATLTVTGGTTQATTYAYNHRGLQSGVTSGGETWSRSYNLLGQVTGTTDPNAGASTMTYDPNGNLATTSGATGHTISYTYDALNRKTGEFDGASPASSPQIASWVYDNSNNAVAGMTDPIGHLTTETSYSGGNAYTVQQSGFTALGESSGETVTLPAAEGALAGTYRITNTYTGNLGLPYRDYYPATPGGGALPAETVTHTYSGALDMPNGLGSNLIGYAQSTTWTAFSQVSQEAMGSTTGIADITNTYDPHTGALTDSQVTNTAVSATPFDDTSYTYDPYGNITSQTETRNGTASETQCFAYDTLDRLAQAWTATDSCAAAPSAGGGGNIGDGISGGAYWTSWAFDPLGDWTTQTQHSVTGGTDTVTSYSYNGNSAGQPNTLTSAATTGPGAGSSSYTYDAAGNMLSRNLPSGNQSLTWTHDGKVATATTSSGTTSYVYDADGNLLLQEDPGQTTLYVFGEQIVLNTGSGVITGTRFLSLPGGGTVVRTGSGTNYWFETGDQHGTSTLTLDDTAANPAWRQFDPYGNPRGTAPTSWPDTNAFLGKPTAPSTGLDIIGARQYDPATGRFISIDPLLNTAAPQTLNGYTYTAGNPISQSDPSGEMFMAGYGCPHGCAYYPAPAPIGIYSMFGTVHYTAPALITISPHVAVVATAPQAAKLIAAWQWVTHKYGNPNGAEAEFSDWWRMCTISPDRSACSGSPAANFGTLPNYSLEGAFAAGIKIVLGKGNMITGYLMPLLGSYASAKLGRALIQNGELRSPGFEAHHLVAEDNPAAQPARDILNQFGVDINGVENGVFLPATASTLNPTGAVIHRGATLTDSYIQWVNKQLAVAQDQQQALEILQFMKRTLLGGEMPWLDEGGDAAAPAGE